MPNETPQYCGHIVPKWNDDPETRKRIRQLKERLLEFKAQVQNAHAAILEHTDEVYFQRQKQLFDGSIAAFDHVEVLLDFAAGGTIAVPENWQKSPGGIP